MKGQLQKILDRCKGSRANCIEAIKTRDQGLADDVRSEVERLVWSDLPRVTAALMAVVERLESRIAECDRRLDDPGWQAHYSRIHDDKTSAEILLGTIEEELK